MILDILFSHPKPGRGSGKDWTFSENWKIGDRWDVPSTGAPTQSACSNLLSPRTTTKSSDRHPKLERTEYPSLYRFCPEDQYSRANIHASLWHEPRTNALAGFFARNIADPARFLIRHFTLSFPATSAHRTSQLPQNQHFQEFSNSSHLGDNSHFQLY